MFIIKAKSKKGGFWDEKSKTLARELKVKDEKTAENYKNLGYKVTEEKKTDNKKTDSKENNE